MEETAESVVTMPPPNLIIVDVQALSTTISFTVTQPVQEALGQDSHHVHGTATCSAIKTKVQYSGRLLAIASSFTTLAGKVSKFQRYYKKFKHFKGFLKNLLK